MHVYMMEPSENVAPSAQFQSQVCKSTSVGGDISLVKLGLLKQLKQS